MGSRPRRTSPRAGARPGARRPNATRRDGARPQGARRGRGFASGYRLPLRVGWARRIGVALGVLVVGASVVLAGQALDDPGRPARTPSAATSSGPVAASSSSVPAAPTLAAPADETTTASTIDLSVSLPADAADANADRLLVYVNDELARSRRLPPESTFIVRGVPLVSGENVIAASLSGPAGEGARSAPVTVVRDGGDPVIVISAPAPGARVATDELAISGRTEPLASITVTNKSLGADFAAEVTAQAGDDGRFRAVVALVIGPNEIVLESTDGAGNRGSARLDVVRTEQSLATVTVTVTPDALVLKRLPATLDITASVADHAGRAVRDAEVVFSLSVPGLAATTYRAPIVNGTASWLSVGVPRTGTTKGRGRVTAQLTLESGQQLVGNASFSVR
jgi:hypothetical protein